MKHTAKRATVHEILRIAMDLERRTMSLYTAFVSHHGHVPELQKFWLTMARHEAGHFGSLALVESMLQNDPKLGVGQKVWFDDVTIVRLRSLLAAYLREAQASVTVDRALEMAIDLESSELEDVVVDLMHVVSDPVWRHQAVQYLIHDLGDLSYMVEKFTRNPKLLKRADELLDRRVKTLKARRQKAPSKAASAKAE
jgi:rubrerythrin